MDRELSSDTVKKRHTKKIIKISIIILAFVIAIWIFRSILTPSIERSRIRYSVAELGAIEETISTS